MLVVYNNSGKTRELKIPVEDTPLETAHQLQAVLGESPGQIVDGKIEVTLPAQTIAVFNVH